MGTDISFPRSQRFSWATESNSKQPNVELRNLTPTQPPSSASSPPTASWPPQTPIHHARDRVLATPELLEAILSHIPLNELLTTAPLVSSTFYDTISDSVSLQQALFLLPDPSRAFGTPSPLLYHGGVGTFRDERFPSQSTSWDRADEGGMQPLMWEIYARKMKSFSVRGASWRRMLVVQPPIKELILNGGNVLRNETGITMGQLENCVGGWRDFKITKEGRGTLQDGGYMGR